jgi:hypothetical protein
VDNIPQLPWTKILKAGSSLGDLETRSASDLTSGTLAVARLPALSGDATAAEGTGVTVLATVNSTPGSYGSGTQIPIINVNGKGLVTSVTNQPIQTGALTRANDTNITLTLTGTPATALLKDVLITAGWTGTLAVSRGGTNLGSYAVGDLLYASGSTTLSKLADVATGSVLISGGVTTAPAWSATPTVTSIAVAGGSLAGGASFLSLIPTGANIARIVGGTDKDNQFWITTNSFTLGSSGTLFRQRFSATSGNAYTTLECLTAGTTAGSAQVILEGTNTASCFLSVPFGGKIIFGAPVAPPATSHDTLAAFVRSNTAALFSAHSIEDLSTLDGSGNGSSYATFDSKAQIIASSAVNYDHIAGFQARMEMRGSGTLTTFYGFLSEPALLAGTTTNSIGFQVRDPPAGGTVTNNYGLYVDSLTRGGTANWAVYVAGTTLSYFGGHVGVGITPTAVLHLQAGSATANTAPLKLTSGTVLTTAEAGAIEFTTDDFFATITTGAARKAFILDDGARLTSGKIPIATTNGRLIDGQTPLSGAKVYYVSDTSGGAVTRKLTFTNGILTAET